MIIFEIPIIWMKIRKKDEARDFVNLLSSSINELSPEKSNINKLSMTQKRLAAKRKIDLVNSVITKRISTAHGIESDFQCSNIEKKDYQDLISGLVARLSESKTSEEKKQILTLSPTSWSNKKVADTFGCNIR